MSCSERSTPDRLERAEIEILQVRRRGLQDRLELVIVLHAIGVLAIAAVLRATRRLHIGRPPRLGAERAQRRGGMKRARADLHVVGLQHDAPLLGPERLERQDQPLEGAGRVEGGNRHGCHIETRGVAKARDPRVSPLKNPNGKSTRQPRLLFGPGEAWAKGRARAMGSESGWGGQRTVTSSARRSAVSFSRSPCSWWAAWVPEACRVPGPPPRRPRPVRRRRGARPPSSRR